jgi:UDPglucose 6-dehydrogenase
MFIEFDYMGVTPQKYPNMNNSIITCNSAIEAATGAHAIAILTEWDEFTTYDYEKIYEVMSKPAFLFDGRNIVDHAALRRIGFEVYAIGKPSVTPKF